MRRQIHNFNAKHFGVNSRIFILFPHLLYINRSPALPSLCTASHKDGWAEGFEQREIKTDAFGTIYVSFWNPSDSWHIEAEMTDTTDTADIEEEESLDMGGISM